MPLSSAARLGVAGLSGLLDRGGARGSGATRGLDRTVHVSFGDVSGREYVRQPTAVRYDERGCGLSDTNIGDPSVDVWVGGLEAVVDAMGLEPGVPCQAAGKRSRTAGADGGAGYPASRRTRAERYANARARRTTQALVIGSHNGAGVPGGWPACASRLRQGLPQRAAREQAPADRWRSPFASLAS
jgi:hypothetical protein